MGADQSATKMPRTAWGILHRTVLHNRWMNLVVSFFIMSCAGALYSFGLYSQKLKTTLGYNQETVSTIGLFKDLGANIGIVAGILYDSVGSWLVLLLAGIFNILGYMMAWAAITGKIAKPQVWQMCAYLWIGASSGAFASTAVIVSCVKNFPRNRGIVIGLLKGFVGLSGAMLTQIYRALYGEDPSSFILVVAWFPCFVFLLFMFVVRPLDRQEEEDDDAEYEMRNFYVFLAMALLLAMFLMVVILLQHLVEVPRRVNQVLMGVMVLILALPVYVVVESEWRSRAKAIGSPNQGQDAKEDDSSQLNPAPAAEVGLANKMPPSNDRLELAAAHETQNGQDEDHGVQFDAAADNSNSHSSRSGFAADTQLRNSIRKMPPSNLSPTRSTQQESSASQACTETEKPPKQHSSLDPESLNSGITRSELKRKPNIVRRLIVDRVVRELKQMPQRGEDHTVIQALASLDLWILFIATTAGLGSGLMAIDNLGQMGASLGYSQSNIATFVSLLSIWNFFGRVGFGFLSELMLQRWGSPRPLFLAIVLGLLAVGHLYVAFALKGALYIGSVLIGLCFGAQMPIMFAIISEIFGLAYFGTLYNVGILASPLGVYLLSVKTAGHLYDLQAQKQEEERVQQHHQRNQNGDLLCYGSICYRNSLFIMAAVCVFGCIISALLAYRTKQYYKSVHARARRG